MYYLTEWENIQSIAFSIAVNPYLYVNHRKKRLFFLINMVNKDVVHVGVSDIKGKSSNNKAQKQSNKRPI